jgi:hypothetical protein
MYILFLQNWSQAMSQQTHQALKINKVRIGMQALSEGMCVASSCKEDVP